MTDPAYQARLADALLELSRMLAQGSAFVLACDHCAKAWRVGYRELEARARVLIREKLRERRVE